MQPLFKFEDTQAKTQPVSTQSHPSAVQSDVAALFDGILNSIEPNRSYWVPSYVRWSAHQLLAHLLTFSGNASVYLTSYAISDTPMQGILKAIKKGTITDIRMVLDKRVLTECPKAYQLVQGAKIPTRLASIHAKSFVLLNDTWGITVLCSANFTEKRRVECYAICTDRNVALATKNWIMEVYDGAE